MISSGFTELRKAFLDHTRIADSGKEESYYLLLFYGLECGLKSIYLKRNKILRIDQISDDNLRSTHDLFKMIRELRLPAQIARTSAPSFRLARDGTALPIKNAHEAWRYGILIRADDLENVVGWMHDIRNWIKETI
jgi:hypothetical protein